VNLLAAAALAAALAGAAPETAPPSSAMPPQLREVGFDQRLGERLPLDLQLRDETGRTVRLGDYFGRRPVVLALVYYECPMLCTLVLNGLESSLRALELTVGQEFEVVTVSFDPRETPQLAAAKKDLLLRRYGRAGAERGWHFLTGESDAIRRLTAAAGFRFVYDQAKDQFAHPAGVVVATPDGTISRYFYGAEYPARDLRLGLVEASAGRIGGAVDQLLLLCFHYDPQTGRYSAAIWNLLRVAGGLTVLAMAAAIAAMVRRERRRSAARAPASPPGPPRPLAPAGGR
jgi:protein SCO1/2